MKKANFLIANTFVILVLISFFSCGTKENTTNKTLTVYAAASLTDVLNELIDSFKVAHNINIVVNYASSGTIARQIEQGAKADIFISASKNWANYIDSIGLFVNMTSVAQNELVVIAPKTSTVQFQKIDSSFNILSVLNDGRLSIGDPKHVPAGKYAKQSLEYYDLYSRLTNKILPAKDVRSALLVVEMGEVPLGIVYKTDALKSQKVKTVVTIPLESHSVIEYYVGVCNEGSSSKAFYEYVNSAQLQAIWEKYGFSK